MYSARTACLMYAACRVVVKIWWQRLKQKVYYCISKSCVGGEFYVRSITYTISSQLSGIMGRTGAMEDQNPWIIWYLCRKPQNVRHKIPFFVSTIKSVQVWYNRLPVQYWSIDKNYDKWLCSVGTNALEHCSPSRVCAFVRMCKTFLKKQENQQSVNILFKNKVS